MLSIIIPAYNEEKRIRKTLKDYIKFFNNTGDSFEIYMINDASEDQTLEIVKKLAEEYPQIKYKNITNHLGKGGAIIEGFKVANGDLISYADADGSTSPNTLYDLIKQLGDYDVIMGSRWMKGSKILTPQSLSRRIASRGFNLFIRLVLNLQYTDTQCAGKVFRKEVIDSTLPNFTVTNFAFDACLLYEIKKKGFKIKEVPIAWQDHKDSTLNIGKHAPAMFKAVIKERLKYSIFNREKS